MAEVEIESEPESSTDSSVAEEEGSNENSSCLSHQYSSSPFEGDVSESSSDSENPTDRVVPYMYEPDLDSNIDSGSSSQSGDDTDNEERLLTTNW